MTTELLETAIQHTPASPQADREVRRDSPLRRARTCYGHLAGVAGVALMDALVSAGWLEESGIERGRVQFRLTPDGEPALIQRGVVLPAPRETQRRYCYGCVDWTERRYHLGGALASAVLDQLLSDGIVRRRALNRTGPAVCQSGKNAARTVTLEQALESWLA